MYVRTYETGKREGEEKERPEVVTGREGSLKEVIKPQPSNLAKPVDGLRGVWTWFSWEMNHEWH
jgi:hypothetical protein